MSKINYNIAACYLFEVYHFKLESHKTAVFLHTIKKRQREHALVSSLHVEKLPCCALSNIMHINFGLSRG